MFGCLKYGLPVMWLLCSITGFSYGQGYYHSPNDTLISFTTIGENVTMNITQIHTSNDTLQFTWNKLSVDIPLQWDASICDNSNCYTELMENGTTLPVLPGDDGLMLVHCSPLEIAGTGVIRYTIFEMQTPEIIDTLTWIIHAETAGIKDEAIVPFRLIQYGKTKFINQFRPDSLEIYNEVGTLVLHKTMDEGSTFILPDELHGLFIIRLSGKGRSIQKKLWL